MSIIISRNIPAVLVVPQGRTPSSVPARLVQGVAVGYLGLSRPLGASGCPLRLVCTLLVAGIRQAMLSVLGVLGSATVELLHRNVGWATALRPSSRGSWRTAYLPDNLIHARSKTR